jgi:predicted nucleotidyltransferase
MSIPRGVIISTLRDALEKDSGILAVWLEGADATGNVDTFSDIDVCCSVSAGNMDAAASRAQAALESLGKLDLVENSSREDDFQMTVFHLEGTSPYLLIDFNIYVGRGSQFTEGDALERPLILFDRAGVTRFLPDDHHLAAIQRAERLQVLRNTTAQSARIEKYIRRRNFLEAFGYYHKWLLMPLVEVLRMRYTPLHPDYYIVHISRHLPPVVLQRLEDLFKIDSLEMLETKIPAARSFFEETAAYLQAMPVDG